MRYRFGSLWVRMALVSCWMLMLAAGTARADSWVYSYASVSATGASGMSHTTKGPGPVVYDSFTANGNSAGASGSASGSFGILNAEAYSSSGDFGSSALTSATAGFADDMFINAPGMTGQSGRLGFTVNLEGNIFASASELPNNFASAQWQLYYSWGSSNYIDLGAGSMSSGEAGVVTDGDLSGGVYVRDVGLPFTFGQPFHLELVLYLETYSAGAGSAFGIFSNTLTWGGLQITDATFQPVAGVTVTSTSGTDWLLPAIKGDLDGDGFVGLSDLDIVLQNWNQTIPPGSALADVAGPNGPYPDGFVGLDDLDMVLTHWNDGTPPISNVPEPAAPLLVMLGALIALRRGDG